MSANDAIVQLQQDVQDHTLATQGFLNEADARILAKEQQVTNFISAPSSVEVNISTAGDDLNNGSANAPFLSIQRCLAAIPFGSVGTVKFLTDITNDEWMYLNSKHLTLNLNGFQFITSKGFRKIFGGSISVYDGVLEKLSNGLNFWDDALIWNGIGSIFFGRGSSSVNDMILKSHINGFIIADSASNLHISYQQTTLESLNGATPSKGYSNRGGTISIAEYLVTNNGAWT